MIGRRGAGSGERGRRGGALGLVVGLLVLAVTLPLPPPGGMDEAAWRTAGVAGLMATWWVTEAVPIPVTALLPLVLFPILGVTGITETAAPYAHPVIFLFLGGFLIAAGLQRSGLHHRMALTIVRLGGTRPDRLVGSFMIATAFLSMWVSNTATVAMMLPLALSILALAGSESAETALAPALLLGVAYAANVGGMGTLIGTPPNTLLAGFLSESAGIEIGFGRWMLLGVPLVLVALPLVWLLLVRLLYPTGREPLVGGREAIQERLRALGVPGRAEWTVGIVTALTATAWITRPLLERVVPGISDAGIAMAGALLLFVVPTGDPGRRVVLDWEAAEELPWGVLVLFGGGLSLAGAITATGLDAWLGVALQGLGSWPTLLLVGTLTALVVFLTELTSNTATAAALLPVTAALAVAVGADPLLLTVPTALAASSAFMMPVATPPNAIVYGSGRITLRQMMRAGFVVNVVMVLLLTLVATSLAPWLLVS